MDIEDRKVEVLQKLQKHLSRLTELETGLKNYKDDVVNIRTRLERWKERVVQYLRFAVSKKEANLFANITPEKKYNTPTLQLSNMEFPVYRRALENIIEEVEDNPYLFSQDALPVASSDNAEPELDAEPHKTSTSPAADERDNNLVASTAPDAQNVFVIHGRNIVARKALFGFLRSIGLRPLEWSQAIKATGKASPFISEILDTAFSKAQAVVVLMTPDDVAQLREPFRGASDPSYESLLIGQARPNVLFEAGMAMGRNPDRTIIVELGTLRPFSDIAGRHTVRLSNDSAARQELAQRLETAGCPVDLSGKDWHTEGDFERGSIPNP